MLAKDAAFTVIDFETTGVVDDHPNAPWQIGVVFFARGRLRDEHMFSSLINVGERPFNPYAPGRHAQLRNEILHAPTMRGLWPILVDWLDHRLLVAHNVATEKNCLTAAFPMHAFGPWLDTLSLARIAYPDAPSHQLEDLLERLQLKPRVATRCPGLAPHDALYDACASAVLLEHFLALPGWDKLTVEELADARARRYHRRKSGREDASS